MNKMNQQLVPILTQEETYSTGAGMMQQWLPNIADTQIIDTTGYEAR